MNTISAVPGTKTPSDIKVFVNATIVALEDIGVFHQLGELIIRSKTYGHDKLYSPYDGSVFITTI